MMQWWIHSRPRPVCPPCPWVFLLSGFQINNKLSSSIFRLTVHLFLDHLCVHIGYNCSAQSFDTHQPQYKLQYLAPAFSTTTMLTDMPRGVELGVSGIPHYLSGGPISPALTLLSLLQHTSYYSTHYQWEAGILGFLQHKNCDRLQLLTEQGHCLPMEWSKSKYTCYQAEKTP